MTKIEMTGADGAAYDSIVGLQSRVVVFPDGVPRHFTLTNWQWETFDRSHEGASYPFLLQGAYEHALTFWLQDSFNNAVAPISEFTPHGFEARLRRSLEQLISVAMADVTARERPAND